MMEDELVIATTETGLWMFCGLSDMVIKATSKRGKMATRDTISKVVRWTRIKTKLFSGMEV